MVAMRISSSVNVLLRDVQYGLKNLKRHPVYTGVIILSLALGIGANTAVFGWLDTFFFRTLPVPQPKAIFQIAEIEGGHTWLSISRSTFERFRDLNQVFSGIAGYSTWDANVEGDTMASTLEMVSGSYFPMLGLKPAAGRLLAPTDDASSQNAVAVLGYRYWKKRFGSDAAVIGRSLRINGTLVTVIGVAPPAFTGVFLDRPSDIFVPISAASLRGQKDPDRVCILGRLKHDVTQEQAAGNLQSIYLGILEQHGLSSRTAPDRSSRIMLMPAGAGVFSYLREKVTSPLMLVTAAVLLVLMIACANVVNMMLIRIIDRQKEMAVRLALGASRLRLVRLSLIESIFLSAAGGALGLLFLAWSESLLQILIPANWKTFDVNGRVLTFTMILSLLIGIVCGLLPGFRSTRARISGALDDASGRSTGRSKTGDCLITVQIVLSLTLLFSAILCLRSLSNLARVDVGFDKDRVLLAYINPMAGGYEGRRLVEIYEELQQRLQRAHGISSASFSLSDVFQQGLPTEVTVPGYGQASQKSGQGYWDAISAGYFETVGMPILSGRDFAGESRKDGKVAIINMSMSDFCFQDKNPLGKHIRILLGNEAEEFEIIGVAADARYGSLRRATDRMVYLLYTQAPAWVRPSFTIELRIAGAQNEATRAFWNQVHALDPIIPVTKVYTLAQFVNDSILPERLVARVVAGFSLIALLLTCVGIYGTMSYIVGRRTREIGIRIAMGARPSSLIWMVERKALLLISLGIIFALPCGLTFSRFLNHLFFGVSETDPFSMAMSLATITLVGLSAAYWPARKASRVDAMQALHSE